MPVAGVSMIVVIIIAVIMAMMQIVLPKMASIVLVIIILGPWMFQELTTLILDLFDKIPSLLRSY